MDRCLAVASVLSEDLRCSGCGMPRHEAWNPDSDGYYEVKTAECQGCAAIERDRKRDKDEPHQPEKKTWVIDTRPPDEPLREWNPFS